MKGWIELHTEENEPFWCNLAHAVGVESRGAQASIIFNAGERQHVSESLEHVLAKIRKAV